MTETTTLDEPVHVCISRPTITPHRRDASYVDAAGNEYRFTDPTWIFGEFMEHAQADRRPVLWSKSHPYIYFLDTGCVRYSEDLTKFANYPASRSFAHSFMEIVLRVVERAYSYENVIRLIGRIANSEFGFVIDESKSGIRCFRGLSVTYTTATVRAVLFNDKTYFIEHPIAYTGDEPGVVTYGVRCAMKFVVDMSELMHKLGWKAARPPEWTDDKQVALFKLNEPKEPESNDDD